MVVKYSERAEFIGQIIDIFEDFLSEHRVALRDTGEFPDTAIIYGEYYRSLQDDLEAMMTAWGVLEKEKVHNEVL